MIGALAWMAACAGPRGETGHAAAADQDPSNVRTAPVAAPIVQGGRPVLESSRSRESVRAGAAITAGSNGEALSEPSDPSTAMTVERLRRLDPSFSTSIGAPTDGQLDGGVALPSEGPGFVSNPLRPNTAGYFGTVEMVRALVNAAAEVDRALPGSRLKINDLGFENGGPIPHHGSHRSGRDVDILFFLLDAEGSPREAKGVPIDPEGRGWDFGDLATADDDVRVRLDVPRTWRLVQALLEDEEALVQRIFIVEHVRTMLLNHANRVRAPSAVRTRFEQITCQPGAPHDDHLHVRLFCSAEDLRAGCEDSPPMYPWRRAQLRALGLRPSISRGRRRRRRAATVSRQEAREAAGPMHSRVVRFLDRRESWAEKPSPGRPYCR